VQPLLQITDFHQYNIGVSKAKRKIQRQKLKQQLEKGLELLSELSLELTDAEKLNAPIKLLAYLKSVSNEDMSSLPDEFH
jgi:hypothetical protein